MKILIALILALAFGGSAGAQSLGLPPVSFASLAPHLVLWGGTTADILSTIAAVKHGGREANPLLGQKPGQEFAVGYGLTAVMELVARHQDPKITAREMYIIGAFHFGLAGWNLHFSIPLSR